VPFPGAPTGMWNVVQGRYVCLVFEYAATLGLVDVVYGAVEAAFTRALRRLGYGWAAGAGGGALGGGAELRAVGEARLRGGAR